MSRHSFDPKVAEVVGLNAAVIYQNIVWWCEKNAANAENFRDGAHWTYNSVRAYCELFPYLSEKQIRTALDLLEQEGIIRSGNFNKDRRDRTKWYCPTGRFDLPYRAKTSAHQGEPLPDSKPDHKPDSKPTREADASADLFSDNQNVREERPPVSQQPPPEDAFETFWKLYPPCPRKTSKPAAREAFWKIVRGKHGKIGRTAPEVIIEGIRQKRGLGSDPSYYPLPTTWLNGERWAVEDEPKAPPQRTALRGMPIGWQVER